MIRHAHTFGHAHNQTCPHRLRHAHIIRHPQSHVHTVRHAHTIRHDHTVRHAHTVRHPQSDMPTQSDVPTQSDMPMCEPKHETWPSDRLTLPSWVLVSWVNGIVCCDAWCLGRRMSYMSFGLLQDSLNWNTKIINLYLMKTHVLKSSLNWQMQNRKIKE